MLSAGPGLVNTLSIQLQQISAVLAMAQNNPLAAGRAAHKVTILGQVLQMAQTRVNAASFQIGLADIRLSDCCFEFEYSFHYSKGLV